MKKFLFCSGSILLLLVTIMAGIILPEYNSKIDILAKGILTLSNERGGKEFRFRDFQNSESIVANMRSMLMLFESIELKQSQAYKTLENDLYGVRRNSLVILASEAKIVKTSEELSKMSEEWKTKSFGELEEIKREYFRTFTAELNNLVSDENKLKEKYETEIKTSKYISLIIVILQGVAIFLLSWSEYLEKFKPLTTKPRGV